MTSIKKLIGIGGALSAARPRIIMGNDEAALSRLWHKKRGEIEPEDLSGNLIVQLGRGTEDLNRRWFEVSTGQVISDVQRLVRHRVIRWMAATLDGRVEATWAVFEASSCCRGPSLVVLAKALCLAVLFAWDSMRGRDMTFLRMGII